MKIMEVMVPSNDELTQVQQITLLSVYLGTQTGPEGAAQALKGDAKRLAAGEFLVANGFVAMVPNGIAITQRGMQELNGQGLVVNNQITSRGKTLINDQQGSEQI